MVFVVVVVAGWVCCVVCVLVLFVYAGLFVFAVVGRVCVLFCVWLLCCLRV